MQLLTRLLRLALALHRIDIFSAPFGFYVGDIQALGCNSGLDGLALG
jgi:hypothetical protein